MMLSAFKYKTIQPLLHEATINAPIRVVGDVRTWNPASQETHPYTQTLKQVGGKGTQMLGKHVPPPPSFPESNLQPSF